MSVFNPEENTMICMYGPPSFPDYPTSDEPAAEFEEEESFFDKIIAFFKSIFDFIKGLFIKG